MLRPAARRRSAATALLLLAGALAACRGGDASPERRTLIDSRDTYDPRSLDPALSTDVPTGRVVSYLFDGLTRFSPAAELEPGLAERWEVSDDGRIYTFHLRPGVVFHDGTPLRAQQVVHSFERVLDPRSTGGRGWPLYPIRGARDFSAGSAPHISGIEAPDDSTVVITLEEPLAVFPKLLAMPVASIVPDSIPSDFGQHPVGTGPWRFVEWKHDDYLRFARNDALLGRRAQGRVAHGAHRSRAEHRGGRVRVGQRGRPAGAGGRDAPLGADRRAQRAHADRAGAAPLLRGDQHAPRPARRPACATGAEPRGGHAHDPAAAGRRPRPPGRRRRAAGAARRRHQPRTLRLRSRRARSSCSPPAGHGERAHAAALELHHAALSAHRRDHPGLPARRRGERWSSCSATRRPCARRRARARPTWC